MVNDQKKLDSGNRHQYFGHGILVLGLERLSSSAEHWPDPPEKQNYLSYSRPPPQLFWHGHSDPLSLGIIKGVGIKG